MKKIFDKGILHIIPDPLGHFLITSEVDSRVFLLSKDNDIKQIESDSKASYVYRYDKASIFIPSMYYRAVGYEGEQTKKYKTKVDLLEGNHMASCDEKIIYYYNQPANTNAKLWKLNFETGINEEIKLNIPKRKNRRIRYTYISINKDELTIMYYYFGEKEFCFDDMFMRVYRVVEDGYEMIDEKFIETSVRGIYNQYSELEKGQVLLIEKVVYEKERIAVKDEYLALLDHEKEMHKILYVPNEIGNGMISYAISFEKGVAVFMWKHKVLVYDLKTKVCRCDLTQLLQNGKNNYFTCVKFHKDKLLVGSDIGLFELEENKYLVQI